MKYIAIDIGSTYLKSALADLDCNQILEKQKHPSPERLLNKDHLLFEVPAKAYVSAVKQVIDDYTLRHSDIGGVVFATQMHGFVYQTALKPDVYISWQDMRCLHHFSGIQKSYLDYLREIVPKECLMPGRIGLKPSLGICNLYTLLAENSNMQRDGKLHTLGSYIIHALTGNHVCHPTNAAPLGAYDIVSRRWNTPLLERLGFEAMELPRVVQNDCEVCGMYSSNHQNLKIFPDFGDQQVSILGCRSGEGDVIVNIATASQVSVIVEDAAPGDYEVRPYFLDRYIRTVSNMPGGRGLDVLIRFLQSAAGELCGCELTDQAVWQKIHALPSENTDGLVLSMDFFAEPGCGKGGVVSGIRADNLRLAHLFAAAFHHMAQMYWDNIQKIADLNNVQRIICAGGVAWKTPELLSALERISGRTCSLSLSDDESLAGLLELAQRCEGRS